jgi:glycosyltransferase involved in cell wall biosynthesis
MWQDDDPRRVLFLGRMYAGHRTRFLNLQAHTRDDPRIRPTYREVTGWIDGGRLERLPGLPAGAKGRARAVLEASALAALRRPDVIWTAVTEVALPHLWSELGPLRRPLVLDLDWTLEQQEALAPIYFQRPAKGGLRYGLARLGERVLWSRVAHFTPWSTWAADSLRRQGIPADRITVLPPGVDLDLWRPRARRRGADGGKLRLLFVGGNFERKGGRMLLDVVRARFAGRVELDVVTPEAVEHGPDVRVHRVAPNTDRLRELYAQADLFVLPTRAECFGIATIEAMASGLPAIVGDVGGARDIVEDASTGWLIEPTEEGLAGALDRALRHRDALQAMGIRARQVAEARFDGRRNDERVVSLLLDVAASFGETGHSGARATEPAPLPYERAANM